MFTLILTISGISRHHWRITSNWRRSQSGSAMMLIATMMPSDRANSSASKFLESAHALAVTLQPLFVDRLDAQEHVLQTERLPEPEDILVAQQDVAAGFEIELLLDAGPAIASPMAMPCSAWMKATSSTMKTPGSRICCSSSTAASALLTR